jgi:phosphoribosylanthranilate isomerase
VLDFTGGPSFVKICGVTSVVDAESVIAASASALGLIFAQSRRHVDITQARSIADVSKGRILVVGVFRGCDDDTLLSTIDQVGPDVVQIHGPYDSELYAEIRRQGVGVIKALRVGQTEFFEFDETTVDAVLADGPSPGSGVSPPWRELGRRTFTRPVIAAGGLTPSNVAAVLATLDVWGVDVATGVESPTGAKDPDLVSRFVSTARHHLENRKERRD